ncbi:MAG: TadE family protein [Actinomycetota bacterium]
MLVELALMGTFLIVMTLGLLEIGSAWNDHQAVTGASRSGARVGSQRATEGDADQQMLLAIEAALGQIDPTISRVVVFEADVNGDMPAACLGASAGYVGGANCNVYDATSLTNITTPGWWGSGTACGSADGNWCAPTDRVNELHTATYLGVHVEVTRQYVTGLFGTGTHTLSETTVMRLEPDLE